MTTNLTIKKIASVLKATNDEIYAHVRYNVHNDNWEIWVRGKPVEVNFKSHDEAEDRCDEMNYEYMAGKILKELSLKDFIAPV